MSLHANTLSRPPAATGTAAPARGAAVRTRLGGAWTAIKRRPLLSAAVGIVLLGGAGYLAFSETTGEDGEYLTAVVAKGDIEDTVTAVGNLQPRDYVDVGAQVSGQLKVLHVDIGDTVKKGQLLAEIDPLVLEARVAVDQGNLSNLQAQAADKQAQLALAKAEFARQQRLMTANATSRAAYDAAQQAMKSAQAQVGATAAQIASSRSTLSGDQTTLGYTKIYAPMDGTVVSVTTKQGMTINANQQAPVILRVADLSTMTVWTQVSEADVAKLKIGMPAYFTTLGRDKRYDGKLTQIQPTPEVVNNVVLYTATFDVANPDNDLMTQMTAQVFFVTASAHDVIVVPVSALHTRTPGARGGARNSEGARSGEGRRSAAAGEHRKRDPKIRAAMHTPGASRAFVQVMKDDGTVEGRMVVVGVKNRVSAQVLAGLAVGEKVVTGRKVAETATRSADRSGSGQRRRGGGFGGPPGAP